MRKLHYKLVDVFTGRPFAGNQLAVFTDGRDLPTELMQAVAKEMNLSESVFIQPPDDPSNHFRLRIFTPDREMPMAGHPTVGASYVLARERMVERSGPEATLRLEEHVGLITVRITFEGDRPVTAYMTQLLPTFGPRFDDREAIATMLSLPIEALDPNLPIEVVSCGFPLLFIPLASLEAARNVRIRLDLLEQTLSDFPANEIFVFTREVENAGSIVHSRMFAPGLGILEDPATGGASGPLGSYLVRYGLVPTSGTGTAKIVSEQGIEIGRPSFIHIEIDHAGGEITGVRVGGEVAYMGEGTLEPDI
jgi:trans-2,3-dihydro-3-hydroxyanthranilate isomerase